MNLLARRRPTREFDVDSLLWGVQRRRGYGVVDDPRAHRGRDQHAFVVGDDTVALCGFRPNSRWRRNLAVPLAMATEYNPRCVRCVATIPFAYSTKKKQGPMAAPEAIQRLEETFPLETAVPLLAADVTVDFNDDLEVIPLGAPTTEPVAATAGSPRTSRRRRKRAPRTRLPKAA